MDISTQFFVNDFQCIKPQSLDQGYPPDVGRLANTITQVMGREPTFARLLIPERVMDDSRFQDSHTIKIVQTNDGNRVESELLNMVFIKSQKVFDSKRSRQGILLAEFADPRFIYKKWSGSPSVMANWRNVVKNEDNTPPEFWDETLLPGGGKVTWEDVLTTLWSLLPVIQGVGAPDPSILDAAGDRLALEPENMDWTGLNVWEALNDVLEHLSLSVYYGGQDFFFADMSVPPILDPETFFDDIRRYDFMPVSGFLALSPQAINCSFHTRTHHGQERETTAVTNYFPRAFAQTGGGEPPTTGLPVWCPMFGKLDFAQFALLNQSDVDNYANTISPPMLSMFRSPRRHRVYAGFIPIAPNSIARVISCHQGTGETTTTIINHPGFPRGDWTFNLLERPIAWPGNEAFQPRDWSRRTTPDSPRVVQNITAGTTAQINNAQRTRLDFVDPSSEVFIGQVTRYDSSETMNTITPEFVEEVYFRLRPAPGGSQGRYLPGTFASMDTFLFPTYGGDNFTGRMNGTFTPSGGNERPLYMVQSRKARTTWYGKATSAIGPGIPAGSCVSPATGSVELYDFVNCESPGSNQFCDTNDSVTVANGLPCEVPADSFVILHYDIGCDKLVVLEFCPTSTPGIQVAVLQGDLDAADDIMSEQGPTNAIIYECTGNPGQSKWQQAEDPMTGQAPWTVTVYNIVDCDYLQNSVVHIYRRPEQPCSDNWHILEQGCKAAASIEVAVLEGDLDAVPGPSSKTGPVDGRLWECVSGIWSVKQPTELVDVYNINDCDYANGDTVHIYERTDCPGEWYILEGACSSAVPVKLARLQGTLGAYSCTTADIIDCNGQVLEPDVDVCDQFNHPIDGGKTIAVAMPPGCQQYVPIQVEMDLWDRICDVECVNGEIILSFQEMRKDYPFLQGCGGGSAGASSTRHTVGFGVTNQPSTPSMMGV